MGRLATVVASRLIRALKKLGWVESRQAGSQSRRLSRIVHAATALKAEIAIGRYVMSLVTPVRCPPLLPEHRARLSALIVRQVRCECLLRFLVPVYVP